MLLYLLFQTVHYQTLRDASSQFSSFAQSCPTLCDPMDCSTPGFPVHHQLLEFVQTHVHRVGDAIQPSHPLLSPSPPASIFPSIRVFSNESVLRITWPKYWSLSFSISPSNEYSGGIHKQMKSKHSSPPPPQGGNSITRASPIHLGPTHVPLQGGAGLPEALQL